MLRTLSRVRLYSTHPVSVPLTYEKYASSKPTTTPPLVICHGLFGSKQNWKSLAKAMSARFSRDVYTVDLRNHGASPHTPVHTYEAMSEDLVAFIQDHHLTSPVFIGHSMGGKAVMKVALDHPDKISKLVVVDMPPVSLKLSRGFNAHIKGMKEIEAAKVQKQSEADAVLAQYEPDRDVRMFLLTNLRRQSDGMMNFRVPLDILESALQNVGGFEVSTQSYHKPTLFIVGGKSPYYSPFIHHAQHIDTLFPNASMKVIEEAGHWVLLVHAEQPEKVMRYVGQFLEDS
ncbi:Alpha/Beta hydrolase protein [Spinellus fusiger]|nr:Alpha/Beta hydrolase protein [Spinellus fusiger]